MEVDSSKKALLKKLSPIEQIAITFLIAFLSAIILKATLYLRPGPFGTPFVLNKYSELLAAIFFEGLGLALLSLPFFALAYFSDRLGKLQKEIVVVVHMVFCFISLIITHSDHEIQRFMGIRLSYNYLQTYGRIGNTPVAIGHAFADDFGGFYSAYFLIAIPVAFLVLAIVTKGRVSLGLFEKRPRATAIAFFVFFLLAPALAWLALPQSSPLRNRVKPPVFLVSDELGVLITNRGRPEKIDHSTQNFQSFWKRGNGGDKWVFSTPGYPLRKRSVLPCAASGDPPWNFIVIQLETFRALDMKLTNPSLSVSPTPFLDQLGGDPKSAYWTRFFANGSPTVYAFMAIQTGLFPHSQQRVATAFSDVEVEGMTRFLRKGGYKSAFFSGPDPDWDNESFWLDKWYDYVVFRSEHNDRDRPLFKEAAGYLKEHGSEGPFFVMVASISNHVPFRSPEPELDITDGKTTIDRLRNTMRYTDDVVREFVESVRGEPWFDRTILIITGDHGYDLGDRGVMIGHSNLRHETTWVPFIMHGNHPSLPRGVQSVVGSHIDIAPTVLDLAGRCDENSMMGHSLIGSDPGTSFAAAVRDGSVMCETEEFSAYFPMGLEPMLFDSKDIYQRNDISTDHQSTLNKYRKILDSIVEVSDWVYERNRVVSAH